jgi:hypothetical protein
VQPGGFHSEEVRKGNREHTPYDQDGPQYRGKTLPNLEKAERPTLVKLVQLREPLAHQGPLLLDHDPGVEDDDLLDLTPLRLREACGELVELF